MAHSSHGEYACWESDHYGFRRQYHRCRTRTERSGNHFHRLLSDRFACHASDAVGWLALAFLDSIRICRISVRAEPIPARSPPRFLEARRNLASWWLTDHLQLQCLCDPNSFSVAPMFPKFIYKLLLPALLAGLLLRLFFIWRFPFYSGDTAYYEELARNWLYHGVYGFYSHGQLLPSDARTPGYPAFLAIIYFLAGPGRKAVMLVQAFVDLATCVLAAGIAARLAVGKSEANRGRVAAVALWLAALCPFTANYAAVPLTEVLAIFFTTLAILIFLSPAFFQIDLLQSESDLRRAVRSWLLAGFVVGLGTLVRPETP